MDLISYSKIVKKGSMRFLKKKYIENDYTVLYDVGLSKTLYNVSLLKDLKNLIIDTNSHCDVNIPNIQAENIYFLDNENLGGLTIPVKTIMVDSRGFYFSWNDKYPSKIKKINIITNDGVKTINVENLEEIFIIRGDYPFEIKLKIEEEKKIIYYVIDINKKITEKKEVYYFDKSDIKNNALDLREYIDYNELVVDVDNDIKVKDLIIDKKCFKHLHKIYDAISFIHYDNLVIIDNNDMKLIPNTIILPNTSLIDIGIFERARYLKDIFYIMYRKEKIIYYKDNEIKVIDKNELLKDKNIEDIEIYLEEFGHKHEPIIIIKYKNNKTKFITLDEEIELDILFNDFNLLYLSKYYSKNKNQAEYYLENNDWYSLFEDKIIDYSIFKEIYIDYLVFLNNIETLHNKGFSYKAIKYLYENHFDNIVDFSKEDSYYIEEISEEEINKFNELGNIYVKKKKLNK